MSEQTRKDTGLIPEEINIEEHKASLTPDGRHELGIFPPVHLQHYSQLFAGQLAAKLSEVLLEEGVDPETVSLTETIAATSLVQQITGVIDFGYAARVLEERASLPVLDQDPRYYG